MTDIIKIVENNFLAMFINENLLSKLLNDNSENIYPILDL